MKKKGENGANLILSSQTDEHCEDNISKLVALLVLLCFTCRVVPPSLSEIHLLAKQPTRGPKQWFTAQHEGPRPIFPKSKE